MHWRQYWLQFGALLKNYHKQHTLAIKFVRHFIKCTLMLIKEICYEYISKLSFGIKPTQFAGLGIKAKYAKSQKGAIFCWRERQKQKLQNMQKAKRARFFAGAKGKSKKHKKEQ